KNIPVELQFRRGNVEKDEIGDPTISQSIDGIADRPSDNQTEGERGQSVLRVREPYPEQQHSDCLEGQQYPLTKRPLGLEKPVTDACIAGENDVDEWAKADWAIGGEIKHEQEVSFTGLIDRTDNRRYGKSKPRQGTGEIGHELLRRFAHGFPFAQGLSVTRRDVGIIGIFADVGKDFPRARAFFTFGEIGNNRYARDLRQTKRPARPSVVDESYCRCDAYLGEIAIDHRFIQLSVRHVHDRMRLERGADTFLCALNFQRTGDDTPYGANLAPLVSQLVVSPRRRNFRKDF